MFYTAFSVISRLLSIFSLHSTAKSRTWNHHYQIINQFLKAHQNVSQWLENCAILCKRKDVKVTEESQPNGPRSRYEPYWTYQVQDGWLDHVELRNPMRGGAHSPPPLQGCTRERLQSHGQRQLTDSMPRVRLWHVAFKNKFDFHGKKKKKFTHAQQTDAAPTNDWRQRQCGNSQCDFMVAIWKHPERSGKYISHTFTFTKWSKHT